MTAHFHVLVQVRQLKGTNCIPLTHEYMTAHFHVLVQVRQLKGTKLVLCFVF